ncbi:MAG: SH3 domain-containing protein [Myxococcota bacterium]|nr:SH3 domain-containing protein [Myxococcota bacterium]MDW8363970.1 SH3 domain-containing protein [Myxococcales bacterium]
MTRRAVASLMLAGGAVMGAVVARADQVEPYARVVVESTSVHAGPGTSYRRVGVVRRGEVHRVVGRSTRGYWIRVEMPDGTSGFVRGETVYVLEVGESEADAGRWLPALFAPPPLREADGEIAVGGGILGRRFGVRGAGGLVAARPAWFLSPHLGLELGAVASVSQGGRLFVGTAGGVVNLTPEWPFVPFVVGGAGAVRSDPNADTFLLERGTAWVLYGGGGMRLAFRHRITLRLEVRAYAFHEPDRFVAREEVSGGLSAFF